MKHKQNFKEEVLRPDYLCAICDSTLKPTSNKILQAWDDGLSRNHNLNFIDFINKESTKFQLKSLIKIIIV